MTISEFSRDAVCQYLRSVVLIDDNLFNASGRHSRQNDLDLDGPPILILNKDGVAPDLATMTFEADEEDCRADDNWVDARSVTDGFAKEGIVCGVYEPKEFPETNFEIDGNFKTLLKVCTNADVFILDWHLFWETYHRYQAPQVQVSLVVACQHVERSAAHQSEVSMIIDTFHTHRSLQFIECLCR